MVDEQSALSAKFEIRLVPLAIAANIADLCEIDLSPGSKIVPARFLAWRIIIMFHFSPKNAGLS